MGIRKVKTIEYHLVRVWMIFQIWWLGCRQYKNPFKSFKVVHKLISRFKRMMGSQRLTKAYRINNKYAWDMFNPAFPSKAFNSFFINHLHEIEPISEHHFSFRRLLIAITKRCPLQCEHCSEAATLYKDDVLSYEQFIGKIDPFVQQGVSQLIYSGGEPLNRFDDLIKFINRYREDCEQWIYTSAFGLTFEKAQLLKEAGLHGAAISLDHHIEEAHNLFRGNRRSYAWVLEGIKNMKKAGILVALNVCPTRQYIESGGVEDLIQLARKLDVPIVNILEPRAVGNYQDQAVELLPHHQEVLTALSYKYNYNKKFADAPTILYPASFRKTLPCGGGKSYLLLDYDGTLYPCPFCKTRMSKAESKEGLCKAS